MNIKKFFLVEVLSCFFWALVYTVPGYYAAQALVSENINLVDSLLILIGVVVLFILIRYFSKKYK
jgi:membrane protein DedA with SNARE-associated domain